MPLPSRVIQTRIEAGCDEAGRGCLAGPVVAAAVILPQKFCHASLRDSKLVSPIDRFLLREIIEQEALSYAVAFVSPIVIDKINILQASYLAMNKAVRRLSIKPEHLLIDGNRFENTTVFPHTCIIKGDNKVASIAAASILAKYYRDEYMISISTDYPNFGWRDNKGYPTLHHRKAIIEHGYTSHHRMSFGVRLS